MRQQLNMLWRDPAHIMTSPPIKEQMSALSGAVVNACHVRSRSMFWGVRDWLGFYTYERRLLETNATRMNWLIDITPPSSTPPPPFFFFLSVSLLLFCSVLCFVCLFVLFCCLLLIYFVVIRTRRFVFSVFVMFSQWCLLCMYNVSYLGFLSLSFYSDNTHQLQTKQFISINVS